MTSMLGLLALLIAFTFPLALQLRQPPRAGDQRSQRLGTTWLRTQLPDEPNRARLQGLLRR